MRPRWIWLGWAVTAFATSASLAVVMTSEAPRPERRLFLPSRTTDGHYQIELTCFACHTPFGGVANDKCLTCHGGALAAADSHPNAKFADPRNAELLTRLDARRCVSCHREHRPAVTRAMDVTRPDDFCVTCHADVPRERASHSGMAFTTCSSAGCHNYHDNSALYEDFLIRHAGEPDNRPQLRVSPRSAASGSRVLAAADADGPTNLLSSEAVAEWQADAHSRAGVNCSGCHQVRAGSKVEWTTRPGRAVCATCHAAEEQGFLSGKHGMRLASGLSPMEPRLGRLRFTPASMGQKLSCESCHPAHRFDTRRAAVEACRSCHDDDHTRAYDASPHAALWRRESAGTIPSGSGVSCATCHLPRAPREPDGATAVEHNQSLTLRPNEKMLRPVCLECHGLAFSLDALADRRLITANFTGRPIRHVESIDMARRRLTAAPR